MGMYKTKSSCFYIQWKDSDGKWRARSLGKDEKIAKARYKKIRFKDLDKIFLGKIKKDGSLFSTIAEEFLEYAEAEKSPRTIEDYQRAIKLWLDIVGDKAMDEVKIADIMYFDHYRKTNDMVNKATLRINLSAIRAIFNWAGKMQRTTNYPFQHYKIEAGDRRGEYMSKDDLKYLINITPEPWKTYFIILAITGWRPSEFCNLKWNNIKDDVIILNGKSGKREFPIIDKVGLKILPYKLSKLIKKCRKVAETEYFFEINGRHPGYSWLKETFAKYAKQINPKYSLYTLRHSFATQLLLASVNTLAVSKLLGHQSLGTTMIYEHVGVNNIEKLL